MRSIKSDGTQYEYRSYIYEVIQPKKHQITAQAAVYMEKFITESGMSRKYGDECLTQTQNQIMSLIFGGKDRQEIADALNIQLGTLNAHLNDVYCRYKLKGDFKNSKALVTYLKNTGRL